MRRRAVIAASTGIAGTVGLVLLGVGAAAAASGPSPGPAAEPTPVAPATTVVLPVSTDVVEIGLPPVPSPAAIGAPASTAVVAQEAPALDATGTAASTAMITPLAVLPRTGHRGVVAAWALVVGAIGAGLLAVRSWPRRTVRPLRVRTRSERLD